MKQDVSQIERQEVRQGMPEQGFRWPASLVLAVLVSACGGGGASSQGNPPPSGIHRLTLTSATPADGATGVARDVAPQLTFTTALDSFTATAANISLSTGAVSVPLGLSVSGPQLNANPLQRLLPLTDYALRIGAGLVGTNGEQLSGEQIVRFKTADAAWTAVQEIGLGMSPQLAVDPGGNVIAVWTQFDGTRNSVWASRYTVGSGWGTGELIEFETGDAGQAQVVVDESGNAIAVWPQHDGIRANLWTNRYVAGTGWGTPEMIEAQTGNAGNPRAALDAGGNVVVVWLQSDGDRNNVWSNRYAPGSGWGAAELIESDDGNAVGAVVATDRTGNALALWRQHDGARYNMWANRYGPEAGWGIPQLIETNDTSSAVSADLAFDAAGNAIAVWSQIEVGQFSIWSNRYVAGVGWVSAQLIETESAPAHNPRIAVSPSGDALAVWAQDDGLQSSIWSNRYIPATGWGDAQLIESNNAGEALVPKVVLDARGNGIAIWEQDEGGAYRTWINRFVAGVGWGTAQSIDSDGSNSGAQQLAANADGVAVAAWHKSVSGSPRALTARFD